MMIANPTSTPSRSARGFSLIELMIALLMGSLITIAALELFSTNQRTFQLQRGLSDVQEQGRFGLDYISRQVRMIGYEDPSLGIADDAGLVLTDTTLGGKTYSASSEGGTGSPGNDRLTFSRHGTAGVMDCEGDELAAAGLLINTYWVQDNELFCKGSADSGTDGISVLSGVDSFQILIGVDASADNVPAATTYKTLNNVVAADQIVTVRVGLLLKATQDLPTPAASQDILLLDRQLSASAGGPVETPAVRRVFTTTIRVRNPTWENI